MTGSLNVTCSLRTDPRYYIALRNVQPEFYDPVAKQWKFDNSPRGPISIDPETRDIIQPEYLREVKKEGGHLANVEIETLGTAVKDPWKELQKKK